MTPHATSSTPDSRTTYVTALRLDGGRWRPIIAITSGMTIFLLLVFVASTPVAIAIDTTLGIAPYDPDAPTITVGLWAGGNLLLAALIPISALLQWGIFGVRPGRLSSVSGRFRWRWLAEVAVIFVPLWLVVTAVLQSIAPAQGAPVSGTALLLILMCLTAVPLQSAGEEWLFRGLLFRAVGALFACRRVAVVVAVITTSLAFAVVHAPGSAWALGYYLVMGVCFAALTHTTGGLEASSLAHATGNTLLTLPIVLTGGLNDLATLDGPVYLVPAAAMMLATVVIGWRARRRGLTPRTV
ncbi:CPBP family intramembrane metalloprotease [Leucobacter tardus]|uniref:CPBP family intramembrane metalloprotease n=1 Tax=Leucobacter tardus TaxID=501483 RepID=A0A939TM01_9MICO|nr:CPBP family intramembrane glutamic endopeptidase [Leucobacter tardus]MBO2988664.1 CPBP family intramembrane metalloprotease [Leucobacter tardus]